MGPKCILTYMYQTTNMVEGTWNKNTHLKN